MRLPVPEGYVRVSNGSARAVVAAPCAPAVDDILGHAALYDWARAHTERREYMGRAAVYGVPLPVCDVRVVVRRARHGGFFGPLLGDVFLAPTRAPRELAMSLFLRHLGVATPPVVGFATYVAGPMLRRVDVMTAEVPNAEDLAAFVSADHGAEARQHAWRATAALLRRLTQSGVWHPDLNAKNVLLVRNDDDAIGITAAVLDIDRIKLVVPGDPQLAEANLQRLLRSLHKRARDPRNGPPPQDSELAELARLVRSGAGAAAGAPEANAS